MGILKMSPLDWTTRVMEFSQTSLENTLDAVKEVHQTMAEIPLNVGQELGLPKQTSDALKYIHRQVLDRIYDGVGEAVGEVNQYVVKQVQNVDRLANFDPASPEPETASETEHEPEAEPTIVKPAGPEEPMEEMQLN